MLLPTGKGWYIWQAKSCRGGDPDAIVAAALKADLEHVVLKIADGVWPYNISVNLALIASKLQAAGIQAWGWQYVYGQDPTGEANRAIDQVMSLKLNGFVIDAEAEFKRPSLAPAAEIYCGRLRTYLGNSFSIGLSSYRFPKLHMDFPWESFRKYCTFDMPQVYWLFAHNPVEQLLRSAAEFESFERQLPYIPTGAAWKQGSWSPTPQEIVDFLGAAEDLGCSGANLWSWQHAEQDVPQLWQAAAEFSWAPPVVEPPPPVADEDLEELRMEIANLWDEVTDIREDMALMQGQIDALDARMEALENADPGDPPDPDPGDPPDPDPTPATINIRIKVAKTNARAVKSHNASGYPIMQIWPRDTATVNERIQWFEDEIYQAYPDVVRADGGAKYFKTTEIAPDGRELYALQKEVVKLV